MKTFANVLALSVCGAALVLAGQPVSADDVARPASAITKIQRVSTSSAGVQSDGYCMLPVLSPDGKRVVFVSNATTLMSGGGGLYHLYMKTIANGQLRRIDSSSTGVAGNDDSEGWAVFSPDGTKVLFTSYASNLIAGDTNGAGDVFEKDLVTGAVRRLSTTSTGQQANGDSYDARYSPDGKSIVFASLATNLALTDTNGMSDIFVKDLTSGRVRRVSFGQALKQLNGDSYSPSISPDGGRIAYASDATNVVPGDTNKAGDLFVHDLATKTTIRADVAKNGAQSTGFLDDRPAQFLPSGTEVVFANSGGLVPHDTNGFEDIFVKNVVTGSIQRLSLSRLGHQLDQGSFAPKFSADGKIMVFQSFASNVLDDAKTTAAHPDVAFDRHVYVKNFTKGTIGRVSTDLAGTPGNMDSFETDISADGKLVVFSSSADNLVAGDTNGTWDIFVATLK